MNGLEAFLSSAFGTGRRRGIDPFIEGMTFTPDVMVPGNFPLPTSPGSQFVGERALPQPATFVLPNDAPPLQFETLPFIPGEDTGERVLLGDELEIGPVERSAFREASEPDDFLTTDAEADSEGQPIDTGIIDRGLDAVSTAVDTVKDVITGENRPLEFPDLPELFEAEVGFFESFIPNLKLGTTTDPVEKAKIVKASFLGDPRFGGIFQDKFGNPLVVWEDQAFYVNLPGASRTDVVDAIAQFVQFLPAARIAGKVPRGAGLVKDAAKRFAAGASLFGATDLAQQGVTVASGGKDNINVRDASESALFAGAAEALFPLPIPGGTALAQQIIRNSLKSAGRSIPGLTEERRPNDLPRLPQEEGIRFSRKRAGN